MKPLRIGISGWTYPPWRGVFFPKGLRQKDELRFAAEKLNSIEINGTFYSLQRPASYAAWHEQVPPDFVFSVKAPRFITHIRRLKEPLGPMANFFASGVLRLEKKLGPILWQLPPTLPYDPKRLEAFFKLLPRDTAAAAALGRKHDRHLRGRAWLRVTENRPIRHALEVRHASFVQDAFLRQLRDNDVACVVADTAGKWPRIEKVTSDFMYVRLHGDQQLYASGYTPRALGRWAAKIRRWNRSVAVYVYFDNDMKVRAPFDALALAKRFRPSTSDP